MKKVQQDMMYVLLQTLLDEELITQDIHDQSRSRLLDTLDWPETFCYTEDNRKEDENGHT